MLQIQKKAAFIGSVFRLFTCTEILQIYCWNIYCFYFSQKSQCNLCTASILILEWKEIPPPHHKLVNWLILTGFVAERFVGFALCVTLVCKTVALSINLMFKCVPLPDLHLQPRAPLHPLTVLNLKRSNKPKPQMTDHCSVKVISSE